MAMRGSDVILWPSGRHGGHRVILICIVHCVSPLFPTSLLTLSRGARPLLPAGWKAEAPLSGPNALVPAEQNKSPEGID